ncbi:MAG: ATP-grasp domain-containing protein, partial [Rhodothermia bacterium]|nr:ATP-grasp domain-containing protein [Rhodothermia bacterium]
LREHLRVPGMGETRTRYFRDKLAMRRQAEEAGIAVPPYVAAINDQEIVAYTQAVAPPWLLKPRMQASATGIVKVSSIEEVFSELEELGDDRTHHLIEKFVPGNIYHVDSIVYREEVVFARVSAYAETPMKVAHEGGIFVTHTVEHDSQEGRRLLEENKRLMRAMGHRSGVAHTEFIIGQDGKIYFLETAARVGGAHIAEMVEAASGINLWREWAHIETLRSGEEYRLPEVRADHAGLVVSLARQEYPDLSSFDYPEVVWRLQKRHHAGLIVTSNRLNRVKQLVSEAAVRFQHEFMAVAPLPDRPSA